MKELSAKNIFLNHGGTVALVISLSVSLGFNIYLARKIPPLSPDKLLRSVKALKIGSLLSNKIKVMDENGKTISIDFADDPRPSVIYFTSPKCGWCAKNEDSIRELWVQTGLRYRFIGLSGISQELQQYNSARHVPFPVYFVNSKDQIRDLGLFVTPQTIVVSRSGAVEGTWQGAYSDLNKKEIEQFFRIKLPSLKDILANTRQAPDD